jgi:hypothetical protein
MGFKSQLNLCNVFSSNALLIKMEEFFSDHLGINVCKLNREEHLAVPLKLL